MPYDQAIGFPRLYAAASLKPNPSPAASPAYAPFSAALCRGLIEALPRSPFPPLLTTVFRGFMPRPH